MYSLKTFCMWACLLTAVCATTPSKEMPRLKPSDWLSPSKLESLKSVDDLTLQQLESMSMEKGIELMQHLYHLSQIKNPIQPAFVPSSSNIPAYIIKPNGKNDSVPLSRLVEEVKKDRNFGNDEVTIFITGLPPHMKTVTKATKKIVEAYEKRYNGNQGKNSDSRVKNEDSSSSSSEENSEEQWTQDSNNERGNLIVIDLGAALNNFKRLAMLDVKKTGDMIGKDIAELNEEADISPDSIHIVAQGMAAHVAGAAARQYTRLTGHKLRRITALDPSRILAKNPNALNGLARGDAKFVDAIHTSVYGMGTSDRVGDIDFYPNGPTTAVPGAEDLVEAAMRATRYFAESVNPGKEHNFPAVAARSLEEYRKNEGYGKRTYMGIDADCDLQGDYVLEVNSEAPFGKRAPARLQNVQHGQRHQWKDSHENSYNTIKF